MDSDIAEPLATSSFALALDDLAGGTSAARFNELLCGIPKHLFLYPDGTADHGTAPGAPNSAHTPAHVPNHIAALASSVTQPLPPDRSSASRPAKRATQRASVTAPKRARAQQPPPPPHLAWTPPDMPVPPARSAPNINNHSGTTTGSGSVKSHTRRCREKVNEKFERLLEALPTPPNGVEVKHKAQILEYTIAVFKQLLQKRATFRTEIVLSSKQSLARWISSVLAEPLCNPSVSTALTTVHGLSQGKPNGNGKSECMLPHDRQQQQSQQPQPQPPTHVPLLALLRPFAQLVSIKDDWKYAEVWIRSPITCSPSITTATTSPTSPSSLSSPPSSSTQPSSSCPTTSSANAPSVTPESTSASPAHTAVLTLHATLVNGSEKDSIPLWKFAEHTSTNSPTAHPESGLVRRVYRAQRPEWLPELSEDSAAFLRAHAASKCGLQVALAVPVLSDMSMRNCQAVLLFADTAQREYCTQMVTTVANYANVIGHSFAHYLSSVRAGIYSPLPPPPIPQLPNDPKALSKQRHHHQQQQQHLVKSYHAFHPALDNHGLSSSPPPQSAQQPPQQSRQQQQQQPLLHNLAHTFGSPQDTALGALHALQAPLLQQLFVPAHEQ